MQLLLLNIIGPPGSGKGGVSKGLMERLASVSVSKFGIGDYCRGEITAGSEVGNTIKRYNDTGLLAPDSIMLPIIATTLVNQIRDKKEGVIVGEGATRTEEQYDAVTFTAKLLKFRVHTIFLNDDVEVCRQRISADTQREGRNDGADHVLEVRMLEYLNHTVGAIEKARGHEGDNFLELEGVDGVSAKVNTIMAFLGEKYPHRFSVGLSDANQSLNLAL